MQIEEQIEASLAGVRREMAPEGGWVPPLRLDGQIAFLELSAAERKYGDTHFCSLSLDGHKR